MFVNYYSLSMLKTAEEITHPILNCVSNVTLPLNREILLVQVLEIRAKLGKVVTILSLWYKTEFDSLYDNYEY